MLSCTFGSFLNYERYSRFVDFIFVLFCPYLLYISTYILSFIDFMEIIFKNFRRSSIRPLQLPFLTLSECWCIVTEINNIQISFFLNYMYISFSLWGSIFDNRQILIFNRFSWLLLRLLLLLVSNLSSFCIKRQTHH
jgi:hypothetical protein